MSGPASGTPPSRGVPASGEPVGHGKLSPFAAKVLHLLYQHRLLATSHLHQMLTPQASSTDHLTRTLRRMRRLGLVEQVSRRGVRRHALWFATRVGAGLVEQSNDVPPRPHRMDLLRATGPLQQHTLAVAETGLAFLRHARQRGDECGPWHWVPEVAHRYRDGGERFAATHLVSDALLHYVLVDHQRRRRWQLQFFLEVDRATMPVPRLAAKITAYARYYDYVPAPPRGGRGGSRLVPAWQSRYPRFPRLLVVLTGADQPKLDHRLLDLAARVQDTTYLRRHRPGFQVGATSMSQLQEEGPAAKVWLPLLTSGSGRTSFLLTDEG